MKRASALWQASPRKVVSALCILMLASLMAVASGASFTSSTPNVGNVVAAGIMQIDSDNANGAKLNISHLVPGNHPQSGTVTLSNTGDADGVLTLAKTGVVNTGAALSSKLDVVITDAGGSVLYSGSLDGLTSRGVGTIAKGATKAFTFTVSFPDSDASSGTSGSDNPYQGAKTTVDFAWNAVSQ